MFAAECDNLAGVYGEIIDLITNDRKRYPARRLSYYFRGENRNHEVPDSNDFPLGEQKPGLYYNDAFVDREPEIFNEALRAFPEEFAKDKTTFEMLTRMQHYGYPTRLLDVSQKLSTALGIVRSKGYGNEPVDVAKLNGFIHVYRVDETRVKYGTSDTVTALSNLARITKDHVTIDNLRYLAYECKNERAGFYWEEGSEVSEQLKRDIQKVWCVKPMANNIRVNFQAGEFFLFGCGEEKSCIATDFHEVDFDNEFAPSQGIARIGVLALTPDVKKQLNEMSIMLDIGDERLYPDFYYHSKSIKEKIGKEVVHG